MKNPSVEEINKKHTEIYNFLAPEYEKRVKTLTKVTGLAVSLFLKYLKPKSKILEVGCGAGLSIKIMTKKGHEVIGIDISPEMVKLARKRNPNSEIVEDDFLERIFDTDFDGVFSFAFIHLFPKRVDLKILRKFFNLLKPGGILYVGTSRAKKPKEGWENKKDFKGTQIRYRKHWAQEEMKKDIVKIGFKILEINIIPDPYGKVWMDFTVQKPI